MIHIANVSKFLEGKSFDPSAPLPQNVAESYSPPTGEKSVYLLLPTIVKLVPPRPS